MSSTETPPDLTVVDDSPINIQGRRDSLEKPLQTRPEGQDLKNRNILLNTTAAPSVLHHPNSSLTITAKI